MHKMTAREMAHDSWCQAYAARVLPGRRKHCPETVELAVLRVFGGSWDKFREAFKGYVASGCGIVG